MIGLLKNVRIKARSLLRRVYTRFRVLPAARHKIAGVKANVLRKIYSNADARGNLAAMQALSARRVIPYARASARLLYGQVIWPDIDISVVTYNGSKWIDSFAVSLLGQEYPLDRIHLRVVDHGSSDDTVSLLRRAFCVPLACCLGSVDIIEQENLGFGLGHDRAIREGKSEFCLVTNLDLEFRADSIPNVVRTALTDTHGEVASWELRQIPYEHPKYYDPVTLETNWSSHACVLLRRGAYERVGGYDPRLFMYAEDVELSYRFRSYGYVLKYVPTATVHHHTYSSAGEVKPLQYTGSTLGNVYVRLRYGMTRDKLLGVALYGSLFVMPSPYSGAKRELWRNLKKVAKNWKHFSQGKGMDSAYYPLRGFDYEFNRDGAFFESKRVAEKKIPLVSVITRTYRGRGGFLVQAAQSVFNQTYPAIELIIVEDGGDSQKDTVAVLASEAPAGCVVRFFPHPKLGRSAAGNAGLAAASGEYMMFLDDDDLLFADHIETLIGAMLRSSYVAAYALAIEVHTDIVDACNNAYLETLYDKPGVFEQAWDYEVMRDHNFIPIQAIVFSRKLFEQRGGFDVELDQLEDWNLWLRYGFANKFAFVQKTTSLFRSPSKLDIRVERAMKLHSAYAEAKRRAMASVEAIRSGGIEISGQATALTDDV